MEPQGHRNEVSSFTIWTPPILVDREPKGISISGHKPTVRNQTAPTTGLRLLTQVSVWGAWASSEGRDKVQTGKADLGNAPLRAAVPLPLCSSSQFHIVGLADFLSRTTVPNPTDPPTGVLLLAPPPIIPWVLPPTPPYFSPTAKSGVSLPVITSLPE